MRASERLLQASGLTVVTVDLSEIFFAAQRLADDAPEVKAKLADIGGYGRIPSEIDRANVLRQAKFSVAVERWIEANEIDAASAPSALLDWNNNHGDDREKCICVHCSNYPRSFIGTDVEISNLDVLGRSLGAARCFGAVKGAVAPGPMTFCRISTDDRNGTIRGYAGEGELTDDPCAIQGGVAVCRVPDLQGLMKRLCAQGFEHHVAMVRGGVAGIVEEACGKYLGWDMHVHNG